MPHLSASAALRLLQETRRDIPFIVVSGTIGEDAVVEMMKAGAYDFISKDSLARLIPAIHREIEEAEHRQLFRASEAERKRAREHERHLAKVLRSIREVSQFIVREKERKPLIEAVVKSLVSTRGFQGAWIILTDRLPGELQFAQAGFPNDAFRRFTSWIEETRCIPPCSERSKAENGVVVMCNPANEYVDCRLSQVYQSFSGLGVCLAYNGSIFGCMGVSVTPEFANDEEEKSLLFDIARDIAFALKGMETDAQRKKFEQQLWQSREFLRTVLDSTPVRVFWKDKDLKYLGCNLAFARDAGFDSPRHIIGKDDFAMNWRDRAEIYRRDDRVIIESGKPMSLFEESQTTPSGKTIQLLTSKVPLRDTQGDVIGVLGSYMDITEHKKAERALKEAFDIINMSSSVAFTWKNSKEWPVEFVSENVNRLFGYTADEFIKGTVNYLTCIHPEDLPRVSEEVAKYSSQEGTVEFVHKPYRVITKDGTEKVVRDRTVIVRDNEGYITHYRGIIEDITELQNIEAQLAQAQKMEAVGRLAGGVAHDFNNMLSVIIGYCELAMNKVNKEDSLWNYFKEIYAAADRSRGITRQLLAFARKETIAPEALDLNATIEGMLKILQKLVCEDIELIWHPGQVPWPVLMDPFQLDQILANLCVNARDAIANVGKITIETSAMTIDEHYCSERAEFVPGDFVLLSVSDDGCGMDRETMDNIFEPFFTTKVGKGTGLGLSTVYGIVKQNNGFINVYSEPGHGTTFKIYLPRYSGDISEKQRLVDKQVASGDGKTVLVVEDEMSILKLTEQILSNSNYKVLLAKSPSEALEVAKVHSGEISLLITDVIMPEMNGKELADKLKILRPGIRCLFMSGYTADVIARQGVLDKGIQFIQKPFSTKDLIAKVRAALDQG
jgi:PAS domain S-box-containing protein